MTRRMRGLALLVGLTVSFVNSTASADWSDDFSGGTTHESWYTVGLDATFNPSGSFSAAVISGDVFELNDPTSAAAGGSAIGLGVVNQPFSDVLVSGIVNPLGEGDMNRDIGLIARANLATLQVYALTVDLTSGDVDLTRSDGAGGQVELDNAPLSGISPADSVYLEFELRGSNIEGRVYDAPGGSLLQTVQAIDSHYAQGVSGILGSIENPTAPFRATFDNVSAITVVPEPSTFAMLLGLVGAGLLGFLRRLR